MRYLRYFLLFIIILNIFTPSVSKAAAELSQNQVTIVKARVIDVLTQGESVLPGTSTKSPTQSLEVEIIEGADKGKDVVFDNDYVMLKKGDVFYLSYTVDPDRNPYYSVFEVDRLPTVTFFAILFVALVLIFGGLQVLR